MNHRRENSHKAKMNNGEGIKCLKTALKHSERHMRIISQCSRQNVPNTGRAVWETTAVEDNVDMWRTAELTLFQYTDALRWWKVINNTNTTIVVGLKNKKMYYLQTDSSLTVTCKRKNLHFIILCFVAL